VRNAINAQRDRAAGPWRRRLAVLGFHKIGQPPPNTFETWFYISASTFEAQLRWINESRWRVISAKQFLEGLSRSETLPDLSVLLTFDDGYRSMRDVALPILRSFDFPAVLFVPTGFIGGTNLFDRNVEPEERMCDWDDMKMLRTHGVSIQSHSASHRRFSTLGCAEQERELDESKAALESGLGEQVELFSYPYGDFGGDREVSAQALRRAGYKAAFLYGGGPNRLPIQEVHHVERIAMGPDTDLHDGLGGA
jgi:peptidoglycan/xylan/chitin deacetylase (PgdA/CDA1 family)